MYPGLKAAVQSNRGTNAPLNVAGFAYLNQTDMDKGISADRLHRIIRTLVRNVYSYHRQYIYDVLLYQYQQDSASGSTERSRDPFAIRDLISELIGDAQQVRDYLLTLEKPEPTAR